MIIDPINIFLGQRQFVENDAVIFKTNDYLVMDGEFQDLQLLNCIPIVTAYTTL